jgi:signal transduction histidine kinase/DNA-binding response OmpR family regulator
MTGQSRAVDSAPKKQSVPWRPTGTLARRFARLILATALMSVLVGVLLSALSLTFEYRARMRDEVDVAIEKQRDLITETLSTDFHGGAAVAARQIARDTGAVAVRVLQYQASGALVPVVEEAGTERREDQNMPRWQRIAAGYIPNIPMPELDVTRTLDINSDAVGTIEVVLSSRPLVQALTRYLVIALLAVMLAAALALLIARRFRRQVAEPIGRLLDKLDTVARTKDFALQAVPEGPDEIGSLTISFNDLLKNIHARNQTLAAHRRQLQELVIERTKSFERAAREAEIASRSKGDFLARMSHEIRTPMNGVIGMAELLENTRLEKQQHHMLQTMRSSADSLLDIINDILDFSRIEAGQLQVLKTQFSPVDLIDEICELLAPRAHERNLELVCDIDSKVPEACSGDPLRLRQIVTNLLGNAIKYTEKGHVILRASAVQQAEGGIQLRVEVEDTGFGMPEEQLQKMFEPFTQGESFESRKQGGTGLGLAITKQLVSLLGGEINVTSKLGSGSKFWITVPFQVEKEASVEPRWQSGVKNVLVVQNDGHAIRTVTRLLEESGSEVQTARTGYAAFDLMVIEEFDLVVADEVLSDMSGYEFVDRIRSSGKSKSVATMLMTTTKPASAALEHASEPDACISKPVRWSRLREAIDKALGRGGAAETGTHAGTAALNLGLRVLLVEDSPVNREVASGMLEALGCKVETASDGSVGVEQALSWGFDAVLMDCQMPLMDGFEATQRIRAAEAANGRKAMPIVALTANALQGDRERCLAAGMSDFISKPFTIKKLQAALMAAKTGKPTFELAPPNPRIKPAQVEEPPVVDIRHIDELRALRKPQLLDNAIALFRKQAAANLDSMERALRAGSAPEVEQHFHALKSCSLSVGARRFASIAGDCEQAARKGDLDAAGRLATRLRPEYLALCKALTDISQAKVQSA